MKINQGLAADPLNMIALAVVLSGIFFFLQVDNVEVFFSFYHRGSARRASDRAVELSLGSELMNRWKVSKFPELSGGTVAMEALISDFWHDFSSFLIIFRNKHRRYY